MNSKAEIINLNNIKKVGRNQPCPCGSGKKHKHCCYNKEVQVSLDEDAKSVLEINDPALDLAKEYLKKTPTSLYSYEELIAVGSDLGSSGYTDLAIKYTKKGIEKEPNNYGGWLNLAAMYGQSDQLKKALEVIEKVPDGYKRRTIIKANILIESEKFDNVAHLYEKAVREEPYFFLPYLYLATHNQVGSETKNYWIDLGFNKIPDDSELGFEWAKEKFFRKEFNELVSDKRIKRLKDQSGDSIIFGQRNESPSHIKSAKYLQEIAFMILRDDESLLQKTALTISEVLRETKCEAAIACLDYAANKGKHKYIDIFHSNVCKECQSRYAIKEHQFMALRLDEKDKEAKEKGRQILEGNIVKNDSFYVDYLSFLDDMEELEEAISIGSKLESKISSFYGKARFFYEMGYYYAKLGEWKVSHLFMIKFSELDSEELYNYSTPDLSSPDEHQGVFHDQIFWCDYNIVLSLIAQKKFEEAIERLNLRSEQTKVTFTSDSLGITDKNVSMKINELLHHCQDNSSDKYYLNVFQNQLEKTDYISQWGGKIKKLDEGLSVSKLLSYIQSSNLSDQIHGQRVLHREELREHADYSDIINSLETELPQIRLIPDSAFSSIIEAETRIQDNKRSFDSAPTIVAYSKSLELTLRHLVFGNFRYEVLQLPNSDTLIEEAKDDSKINQFRGLINFLKSEKIELGGMHQSLLLANGKTAKRVKILGLLQSFLVSRFPNLLEEKTLSELKSLVLDYRNEAAHERSFDHSELKFVRSQTIGLLKVILGLRSIPASINN